MNFNFQATMALFRVTGEGDIDWGGNIAVPPNEVARLVDYLLHAPRDHTGAVRLNVCMFKTQTKTGRRYLSGYVQPVKDQA